MLIYGVIPTDVTLLKDESDDRIVLSHQINLLSLHLARYVVRTTKS